MRTAMVDCRILLRPHLLGWRTQRFLRRPLVDCRFASSSPPDAPNIRAPFSKLLTQEQTAIVEDQRKVLQDLHGQLQELGTPADETQVLRDALGQIEASFMICVVGEFNAGKSTFINALLGGRWVAEGVLPTTERVSLLTYGPEVKRFGAVPTMIGSGGLSETGALPPEEVDELQLPIPWLDELAIVDTPGTNAVVRSHEILTKRIVPRADLVMFVTSADRPFSESERAFLEMISSWGKKVVLIVNKIDILGSDDAAVDEIAAFVKMNGAALLGVEPTVMCVSAKQALGAKLAAPSVKARSSSGGRRGAGGKEEEGRLKAWEASRFAALEELMRQSLTADERVAAKLLSPLGVADSLLATAAERAQRRAELLESDVATVELAEGNMASFVSDMERDLAFERLQIDKVLDAARRRGGDFFERRLALTKVPELIVDPGKFKEDFREAVLRGVDAQIDEVVTDVAVLVEERSRNQARAVLDFLGRRPGKHAESMVGSLHDSHFDGARFQVVAKLQAEVKAAMKEYDREAEAARLQDTVRSSLVQVAALEAGAVTVGGLVAAHLIPDPTMGVATAGAMAVLGTALLPLHRRRMRSKFDAQLEKLKEELDGALKLRMDREVHRISEKILESVAPFSRFVRLEVEKTSAAQESVRKTQVAVADLKSRITLLLEPGTTKRNRNQQLQK